MSLVAKAFNSLSNTRKAAAAATEGEVAAKIPDATPKEKRQELYDQICQMMYAQISRKNLNYLVQTSFGKVDMPGIINNEKIKTIVWTSIQEYLSKKVLNEYTVQHSLFLSILNEPEPSPVATAPAKKSIKKILAEIISSTIDKNKGNPAQKNVVKQTERVFQEFLVGLRGHLSIKPPEPKKPIGIPFVEYANIFTPDDTDKVGTELLDKYINMPVMPGSNDKTLQDDKQKIDAYYQKYKTSVGADGTNIFSRTTNMGNYKYEKFLGKYVEFLRKYNESEKCIDAIIKQVVNDLRKELEECKKSKIVKNKMECIEKKIDNKNQTIFKNDVIIPFLKDNTKEKDNTENLQKPFDDVVNKIQKELEDCKKPLSEIKELTQEDFLKILEKVSLTDEYKKKLFVDYENIITACRTESVVLDDENKTKITEITNITNLFNDSKLYTFIKNKNPGICKENKDAEYPNCNLKLLILSLLSFIDYKKTQQDTFTKNPEEIKEFIQYLTRIDNSDKTGNFIKKTINKKLGEFVNGALTEADNKTLKETIEKYIKNKNNLKNLEEIKEIKDINKYGTQIGNYKDSLTNSIIIDTYKTLEPILLKLGPKTKTDENTLKDCLAFLVEYSKHKYVKGVIEGASTKVIEMGLTNGGGENEDIIKKYLNSLNISQDELRDIFIKNVERVINEVVSTNEFKQKLQGILVENITTYFKESLTNLTQDQPLRHHMLYAYLNEDYNVAKTFKHGISQALELETKDENAIIETIKRSFHQFNDRDWKPTSSATPSGAKGGKFVVTRKRKVGKKKTKKRR